LNFRSQFSVRHVVVGRKIGARPAADQHLVVALHPAADLLLADLLLADLLLADLPEV
jgi:hypothetical protein